MATLPRRDRCPTGPECQSVAWGCASSPSCRPTGVNALKATASPCGQPLRRPELARLPWTAERTADSLDGFHLFAFVVVERQQLFQVRACQPLHQLPTVARGHCGVLDGRLRIPDAPHDGLQGDRRELLRQCERQLAAGCLLSHRPIMCWFGDDG